jgi:hypothetical protein
MPEIALEPRPGGSLGPYRITRMIGRGRVSVDAEGEYPVAVKVVTPGPSQDDLSVRRLDRPHRASDHVAGMARAAGL